MDFLSLDNNKYSYIVDMGNVKIENDVSKKVHPFFTPKTNEKNRFTSKSTK